ncbi:MAG: hypothetical protein HYV27_01385 [Candidatus Hydrogenedentes bacterium]|nr:hypothetical protein [Candidatus Hydrogenedentota bacterium]
MHWRTKVRCAVCAALSVFAAGCINAPEAATPAGAETSGAAVMDNTPKAGGVAIPSEVRNNLGISFAKVEKRQVQDTLRAPGVFELLPGARHEYRALLTGHVHAAVAPFQEVQAGDLLFSIDSPEWRGIQHEAVEAEGEIKLAEAALKVARARLNETEASEATTRRRVAQLAALEVRKADLESEAAALTSSLERLRAEIDAAVAGLEEAEEHFASRLRTLSSITSLDAEALRAPTADGAARWRSIGALEVRAQEWGIVETLSVNQGAWLETGELVIATLDPAAVRFHAEAPQPELIHLSNGLRSLIVPPQGGGVDLQAAMSGPMQIGLTANAEDRTISVYVEPEALAPWARAGVSAYLEIPRETAESELAIPVAALVQEGLDTLFFRRHPTDPNRALPVKADLGVSDGRWVVVRSGVKEGDEVVLDGAYALKLAGGSSKAPDGYHYHADGQLHKNH